MAAHVIFQKSYCMNDSLFGRQARRLGKGDAEYRRFETTRYDVERRSPHRGCLFLAVKSVAPRGTYLGTRLEDRLLPPPKSMQFMHQYL